jgi:hypothetical protein
MRARGRGWATSRGVSRIRKWEAPVSYSRRSVTDGGGGGAGCSMGINNQELVMIYMDSKKVNLDFLL